LQERIRKCYLSLDRTREQLVIFGKEDHPETVGLLGQVDGDALVLSSAGETHRVEPDKTVHLFSQTTMDPEEYRRLEKNLEDRLAPGGPDHVYSHCTICGQMKRRKPALEKFARSHSVMVFVSGRDSSNGRMLFEFIRRFNARSYWISGEDELQEEWFLGAASVGISGATSTSRTQLESVREQVKMLT
jgi:4-hydroxy-3-methylbut-2-enyl diphosphate reductase